jgi:Ribbon-helix-helix protein, copG family.
MRVSVNIGERHIEKLDKMCEVHNASRSEVMRVLIESVKLKSIKVRTKDFINKHKSVKII